MKILALTPTYLPFMGGIEIFADVLARTLRHRSVETVIVADSGGESSRFEVVNGTPVHRLALISAIISRNAAAPLVVLQEIGKLLEAERPDVIHLHSATQAGAFYLDRILRNLRHRPPLVVTQ